MAFLKRNSFIPFISCVLTWGCATSSFDVIKQGDFVVELKVTSDRVLLECEPQLNHEVENVHGFLMYILDDKKTVMTVAQSNILDKEDCFNSLRKIEKILKTGKILYVGGLGHMNQSQAKDDRKYVFPGLGAYSSNGKTIKFMVIANERGLCFDAHDGDQGPCPREPFSLKNLK